MVMSSVCSNIYGAVILREQSDIMGCVLTISKYVNHR